MKKGVFVLCLLLGTVGCAGLRADGFVREIWAPLEGNAFRVNSPDTAEGPYKDRWEAKQDGRLVINVDEKLSGVACASLYLELWGGHPGVAEKRFTLNGKSEYLLPEVGAAQKNCTYSYPDVPLKLSELKTGENVFAFTCDKGETFWGHFLIRSAALRLRLKNRHGDLRKAGFRGISGKVAVVAIPSVSEPETFSLSLLIPQALGGRIASVHYRGRYVGYDENGDMRDDDWHGYTKDREPEAILASSDGAPFNARWNTSMLPDQEHVAVRAELKFNDLPGVTYITPRTTVSLPPRPASVSLHYSENLPRPFWSRAGNVKTCRINLPGDSTRIQKAELHMAIWDGGKGETAEPVTLNAHPLEVAGDGSHDLLYRVVPIDPAILKEGANEVRLLSDTEHHGIEVLLPGPALLVRWK